MNDKIKIKTLKFKSNSKKTHVFNKKKNKMKRPSLIYQILLTEKF